MSRKPSLSPAVIQEMFGEVVPLSEGEESQAFLFHQDGERYIARINFSGEGFQKDLFAYHNFSELPIPEVLRIEALNNGVFLCVSRYAPGVTLQDLEETTLGPTLAPVAEILDSIASTDVSRTSGFGRFDANGVGGESSWRDFLMSITDQRRYSWNLPEAAPLLERIEKRAPHIPEERKLVHGDFGSNNMLVDGGAVTAIIDWSEALLGDPLYDVANIFFWRTWLPCMEAQSRYLEPRIRGLPSVRERLLCYQLRIGLEELYENLRDGDTRQIAWTLDRCLCIARESTPI